MVCSLCSTEQDVSVPPYIIYNGEDGSQRQWLIHILFCRFNRCAFSVVFAWENTSAQSASFSMTMLVSFLVFSLKSHAFFWSCWIETLFCTFRCQKINIIAMNVVSAGLKFSVLRIISVEQLLWFLECTLTFICLVFTELEARRIFSTVINVVSI